MFQNFLTIMGAVLAIVAYELQNTNIQEHQDVDSSFSRGESTTPKLHTNLVYVDRTPQSFNEGYMYVERIQESLDEDYTVRLRDGVRILIERDIATQTSETFGNSELPSLTESDISEDEDQNEKNQIYQEQLLNVLKESMYDLFQE